jgi:hypothetical protein
MFDKPVGGARRVVDDEYDGGESIAVEGWAKTTCLVFPLLWKSRLALVDTAIFDSESRYKQHLFTSICKQKMKSGNTYVEVKRRKKIHLTFDHLDERFTSRCYKRDTNLWGVKRAVGIRGDILSETLGNHALQDLSGSGIAHYEHGKTGLNDILCLQAYIEPKDNIVYRAALLRGRPVYPRREIDIRIDVVAELYSDAYVYPEQYAPFGTGMMGTDIPVAKRMRERIRSASLNVVHHIENTQDMFFTELILEFMLDAKHPQNLLLTGAKSGKYLIIVDMWRWPVGKVAVEAALKEGFDMNTKRKKLEKMVSNTTSSGKKPSVEQTIPGAINIIRENVPIDISESILKRIPGASSQRCNIDEDDIEENTDQVERIGTVGTNETFSPVEKGGRYRSAVGSSSVKKYRSHTPTNNSITNARPHTAPHNRYSSKDLAERTDSGVRKKSLFEVESNPLRTSQRRVAHPTLAESFGRELPAFVPGGKKSVSASHRIIDLFEGEVEKANGTMKKGLKYWRDTRNDEQKAFEKPLDNLRVQRAGVDDLHIKLSQSLRITHEKIRKLELEVESMNAKGEADAQLLAEAEGVCMQVQKRLKKLEIKYQMESEEWAAKNNELIEQNSWLNGELHSRTEDLERERRVFEEMGAERKRFKEELTAALAREDGYLARLKLLEETEDNGDSLRGQFETLKENHNLLVEAHKVLASENEEVSDRYKAAVRDLNAREQFRQALFTLLCDQSSEGVNAPERQGGGFSSYPVPSKRNVDRAVKMLCDGKFRPPPKPLRKGQSKALRQLKYLRATRENTEGWFNKKTATVDGASVFRQLRLALQGGRTLFGKRVSNIGELFEAIDKDNGGSISGEELTAALHRLDLGLTSDQVKALLRAIDNDSDGGIDYDEFIAAAKTYSPVKVRRKQSGLKSLQ